MTHVEIVAAIEARGGRLVASFVLDDLGRTVGTPRDRHRMNTCGECGEPGHTIRRCNGMGNAPQPTYEEKRKAAQSETSRILAERSAARRAARLKR